MERMQTEESETLMNLRRMALIDNSLNSVLQGMEGFHNRIVQYAVSFEGDKI